MAWLSFRRVSRSALRALGPLALAVALLLPPPGAWAAGHEKSGSCGGLSVLPALERSGVLSRLKESAGKVPYGTGKFFRVEKPGVAPSYLFGTIHLTDPRVMTLEPEAESAFAASRTVVIESTDLLDESKMAAALFSEPDTISFADGGSLDDLYGEAQSEMVRSGLEAAGIPYDAVRTLKPWFVAAALLKTECEETRAAQGVAILDLALARRGEAAGKNVEGLETAEEQLEALAGLSLDEQAEGLAALLKHRDRIPDILETMTEIYLKGEIALLIPAIEAAFPEAGMLVANGDGTNDFEQRIITDRNRRMAERLAPLLEEGGAFVAIGALHLPGKSGLPSLLEREGWTLTRADTDDGESAPE